jgi:hypothetical protein
VEGTSPPDVVLGAPSGGEASEIQMRLARILAGGRYRGLKELADYLDGKASSMRAPANAVGKYGVRLQPPEARDVIERSLERQIANAVAPGQKLSLVLGKIDELYEHLDQADKAVPLPVGMPAMRTINVRCEQCRTDEPATIALSDGIRCARCGDVLEEYQIYEGNHLRDFVDKHTGERGDSRQFGSPHDPHFQRRGLGAMFRGFRGNRRNSSKDTDFTVQEGRAGNETRIEYKDDQKADAFRIFRDTASNLQLHALVEERAKDLFTIYRDAKSRLYDFEAVVAACLMGAQMEVTTVQQGTGPRLVFTCEHCQQRFSEKKDLKYHQPCTVRAEGSSSSLLSQDMEFEDPQVYKMDEPHMCRWLEHVEGGVFAPFVERVCAGVREAVAEDAKERGPQHPPGLPGHFLW